MYAECKAAPLALTSLEGANRADDAEWFSSYRDFFVLFFFDNLFMLSAEALSSDAGSNRPVGRVGRLTALKRIL